MYNADYQQPQRSFVKNDDRALTAQSDIPRSKFIGSWTRNTTFDQGFLVPFMVDEILPGDQMSYNAMHYLRMATPVFPIFDNLKIETFYFFVPNRILWTNFRAFMGEETGGVTAPTVIPQQVSPLGGFSINSLADHLGVYAGAINGQVSSVDRNRVNVLPFRAYYQIFSDWFQDQNVEAPLVLLRNDSDEFGDPVLFRRAKMRDYFTNALPWPQKFATANVPLSGLVPIEGIGSATLNYPVAGAVVTETAGVALYPWSRAFDANFFVRGNPGSTPTIFADLARTAGIPVELVRQAMLLQQFREKDARGGTRYTETIRQHFGVISPDGRMQRAEYIGGGSQMMQLTPIAQTAVGASPLGTLGAAGTSVGSSSASYAATEHGFILGLISVQSELSYSQGNARMWNRRTKLDHYWPSLAELGEQAILRQELFITGNVANDTTVFGYQERWHEYRTRTSEVTGRFRPTATLPLDAWHLSQRFVTPPILSQEFIQDNAPMARVLSVSAPTPGQQFLANILINRTAVRPIPMFSTPAQLGRF
ncbi:MAG: major capsid protein [Microvirus sp.]|nr:MAG: major capsid protein [Microvirus sp.]